MKNYTDELNALTQAYNWFNTTINASMNLFPEELVKLYASFEAMREDQLIMIVGRVVKIVAATRTEAIKSLTSISSRCPVSAPIRIMIDSYLSLLYGVKLDNLGFNSLLELQRTIYAFASSAEETSSGLVTNDTISRTAVTADDILKTAK